MRLRDWHREDWETMRRRILRETECFLEQALLDGARAVRIPAHPVGEGHFTREFAESFWQQVLGES